MDSIDSNCHTIWQLVIPCILPATTLLTWLELGLLHLFLLFWQPRTIHCVCTLKAMSHEWCFQASLLSSDASICGKKCLSQFDYEHLLTFLHNQNKQWIVLLWLASFYAFQHIICTLPLKKKNTHSWFQIKRLIAFTTDWSAELQKMECSSLMATAIFLYSFLSLGIFFNDLNLWCPTNTCYF